MSPAMTDADEILSYATGTSSLSSSGKFATHDVYDEHLEDIHANLSKRESIRTSLISNRNNRVSNGKQDPYDELEQDIRETVRSSTKQSRSNLPSHNGRRNSFNSNKEQRDKKTKSSDQKSSHSGRTRSKMRSSGNESCASTVASSMSMLSKDDSENKDTGHRRNRKMERTSSGRRIRSNSDINRLLQYDETGDYSTEKSKRGSSTRRGGKNIRSSSRSGHRSLAGSVRNRTQSCERRVGRSTSESVPKVVLDDSNRDDLDKPRRRSSSQQHFQSNLKNRRRSDERRNDDRYGKSSSSLRSIRSIQRRQSDQENKEKRRERGKSLDALDKLQRDSFEKAWADDRPILGQRSRSEREISNKSFSRIEGVKGDCSTRSGTFPADKGKKTKLEKIHELQGKCDLYKAELRKLTDDRQRYRRKLDNSREEVISLKKIVDEYEGDITALQTKLADVQDTLQMTRSAQRSELTELSDVAKELARVNIDYAKSVEEARSTKTELECVKQKLADREKKIAELEEELRKSVENVKQFEADVLYADEHIDKLESEVKRLEIDLTTYKDAAERDSVLNSDGNQNGDHLRRAKEEAEKRKFEEQENRIKERNRILEEQKQEFEAERKRCYEEQRKKERDFEEQRAREDDRLKIAEAHQQRKEEKMNEILKTLEDENAALKGRLKGEQLDSTIKLQKKDNAIGELQKEVARLTKEQKHHDSAPNNSPALLQEIERLKAAAAVKEVDFEDAHIKNMELTNEVSDLQIASKEMVALLSSLENEVVEQKLEVDNQKRKTMEWQKKSGEWSDKAFKWKEMSEYWEKKAKESNNHDSCSSFDENVVQTDPQALFLAAAVEKKVMNTSTANGNGSWHLRRLFGQAPENGDEAHDIVEKLESENSMKQTEINKLKSELVKLQTNFKGEAYSRAQEYEKLRKEKNDLEVTNANLLKELELARKLNQTISDYVD